MLRARRTSIFRFALRAHPNTSPTYPTIVRPGWLIGMADAVIIATNCFWTLSRLGQIIEQIIDSHFHDVDRYFKADIITDLV